VQGHQGVDQLFCNACPGCCHSKQLLDLADVTLYSPSLCDNQSWYCGCLVARLLYCRSAAPCCAHVCCKNNLHNCTLSQRANPNCERTCYVQCVLLDLQHHNCFIAACHAAGPCCRHVCAEAGRVGDGSACSVQEARGFQQTLDTQHQHAVRQGPANDSLTANKFQVGQVQVSL
jgi:hypothetical protein